MAVAYDSASGTFNTGFSRSVSHTCTGADRYLILSAGFWATTTPVFTSVTYNSVSLGAAISGSVLTATHRLEWYGIALGTGTTTADIVIANNLSTLTYVTAASFTGVHQTTPLGTFLTVTAAASEPLAITVPSAADEYVVAGNIRYPVSGSCRRRGPSVDAGRGEPAGNGPGCGVGAHGVDEPRRGRGDRPRIPQASRRRPPGGLLPAHLALMADTAPDVLDPTVAQTTQYAVPLWLRDLQIRSALARGLPTVRPRAAPRGLHRHRRVWAVAERHVGARARSPYVMACSGASRFLIERGIVPTWHVAVDPLPGHTVNLIGEPHPSVTYLISSTCHPGVFDHLKGSTVQLWHVFDGTDEGVRLLPPGEFALTGGIDVGLRSLVLANFLGFRDLHVFGLDGSYGSDDRRHAGAHPVPLEKYCVTTVDGVSTRPRGACWRRRARPRTRWISSARRPR